MLIVAGVFLASPQVSDASSVESSQNFGSAQLETLGRPDPSDRCLLTGACSRESVEKVMFR
jgi:hypothetical protein